MDIMTMMGMETSSFGSARAGMAAIGLVQKGTSTTGTITMDIMEAITTADIIMEAITAVIMGDTMEVITGAITINLYPPL